MPETADSAQRERLPLSEERKIWILKHKPLPRRWLKKLPQGMKSVDLLGAAKPSPLFPLLVPWFAHLLHLDPKRLLSKRKIAFNKLMHPLIKRIVPKFMEREHVFESKNALLGIDSPDEPLSLPKEPVIWCANHGFIDDIAASIDTTRHSFMFFASIPHFFNTIDAVALYANGIILLHRKIKSLKKAAYRLAVETLKARIDVTIFPEGIWNKSPEKLLLPLWPGFYRMAKETGCKVVPVIHFLADPHTKSEDNLIRTVVADPISMEGLSEEEGIQLLRDTLATWYFLLIEKYGQTTREKLLGDYKTADDAWEAHVAKHVSYPKYYDREIELVSDYRPRDVIRPENVWQNIADIRNIHAGNIAHVQYAKEVVAREYKRDCQRRF